MLYRIIFLLFIFSLGSCSIFFSNDDTLTINLHTKNTANQGKPITILVEQPTNATKFVKANYENLSQQVLKNNIKLYLIKPNMLQTNLKLKVSKEPLAIYFVYSQTPYTRWKYYIQNPQNMDLKFSLGEGQIKEIQE